MRFCHLFLIDHCHLLKMESDETAWIRKLKRNAAAVLWR